MDKDRFRGVILGKAVGDAIGMPIEGERPKICKTYINQLKSDPTIPEARGLTGGQFTDDTQLALELLESLVENNGFNRRDFANRMAKLFSNNEIVGRGAATANAIKNIINGIDLDEVATPAPSAGNGTAMRVAPVGMFYFNNQNHLITIAKEQGQLTHADPRCDGGNIAISAAVAFLIQNDKEINVNQFIEYISATVQPTSTLFAREILKLKEVIDLEDIGAARLISTWGKPDFLDGWKYISPYVIPSVCWSLYSFLSNHNKSFENVIYSAIRVGGDVDTTAAMAGALAGAHFGMSSIPEDWLNQIHDRERWDYMKIRNLADNNYKLVTT